MSIRPSCLSVCFCPSVRLSVRPSTRPPVYPLDRSCNFQMKKKFYFQCFDDNEIWQGLRESQGQLKNVNKIKKFKTIIKKQFNTFIVVQYYNSKNRMVDD